jgi:hypothetical protein
MISFRIVATFFIDSTKKLNTPTRAGEGANMAKCIDNDRVVQLFMNHWNFFFM